MKMRLVVFTACVLTANLAFAQPPRPAAPAAPAPPATAIPPVPPPPPPAPGAAGSRQPINIKVDLTFSEEGGNAPPVKKTVSTVAGDGFSGSVRETASSSGPSSILPTSLNVDASPTILPNGKIRLTFNIQYTAGQIAPITEGRLRTDIRQNLTLVLESGKALRVSEAADPVSDRHVTVEVTATILK